ncbi:hypothetical protein PFLUV_G00186090 [Perca fluviatilis]|uniref:Uncharacterized protein n=1 Tax=Perca fluviatilis TaxID=8168 RepID=A0A6A5EQF7_PERFL|nr:hypothetical protein PFLUV_G00186090 [Perca fluviatilis]
MPGFEDRSSGLDLLWWSLSVGPDEIKSAERRLLEKTYPDEEENPFQDEDLQDEDLPDEEEKGFLEKFTTSPAFLKTSRLGSYCFTFPLEDLLEAYREQFCSSAPPVMRVFKTILYKQEVNYVVLVHSPDQDQFSDYPLLTDNPDTVCTYRDGCFIWRPEAMSETHGYEFVKGQMEAQELSRRHEFDVWDNVSITLHVPNKQVLHFDAGRLRENLKFCRAEKPGLIRGVTFENFQTAEKLVNEFWPKYPSPLEKDE